jgi:hypothetical protein
MVGSHHSGLEADVVRVRELRDRVPPECRLLFFTTVRELLDTLQSWARKVGEHPDEPGDVWGCMNHTNQLGIIEGWEPWTLFPHARVADRLLRYEHLDAELNALLAEYGLGPVTLERVE